MWHINCYYPTMIMRKLSGIFLLYCLVVLVFMPIAKSETAGKGLMLTDPTRPDLPIKEALKKEKSTKR